MNRLAKWPDLNSSEKLWGNVNKNKRDNRSKNTKEPKVAIKAIFNTFKNKRKSDQALKGFIAPFMGILLSMYLTSTFYCPYIILFCLFSLAVTYHNQRSEVNINCIPLCIVNIFDRVLAFLIKLLKIQIFNKVLTCLDALISVGSFIWKT